MASVSKPTLASKASPVKKDSGEALDKLEDVAKSDVGSLSADGELNTGQSSILSNTLEPQATHIYKAHWQIFVPTFVICLLYVVGWVTLFYLGQSGDSLARLLIVVLAVGVPILFAYAFLRYQTISLELFDNNLRYHKGWPQADPVVISYTQVKKVIFSKGFFGRLFGGGTVMLQMDKGVVIRIADVSRPDEAEQNIADMIHQAS